MLFCMTHRGRRRLRRVLLLTLVLSLGIVLMVPAQLKFGRVVSGGTWHMLVVTMRSPEGDIRYVVSDRVGSTFDEVRSPAYDGYTGDHYKLERAGWVTVRRDLVSIDLGWGERHPWPFWVVERTVEIVPLEHWSYVNGRGVVEEAPSDDVWALVREVTNPTAIPDRAFDRIGATISVFEHSWLIAALLRALFGLCALSMLILSMWLLRRWERRALEERDECWRCGYPRSGAPRCSECGCPAPGTIEAAQLERHRRGSAAYSWRRGAWALLLFGVSLLTVFVLATARASQSTDTIYPTVALGVGGKIEVHGSQFGLRGAIVAGHSVTIERSAWLGVIQTERVTIVPPLAPVPGVPGVVEGVESYVVSHGVSARAASAGGKLVWDVSLASALWRLALLIGGCAMVWWAAMLFRRVHRLRIGSCAFCAFPMAGDRVCPECGKWAG